MASVFSRILGQPASEEPTSEQQNEQSAVHKKQLTEMEKRVAALETKVGQLEKQLLAALASVSEKQVVEVESSRPAVPVEQPKQPVVTQLYMAAPSADGTFAEYSTTEQVGKSIYQLTTRNGISGSFIMIDSHDAIATAMISVSQFVKPVCKVTGNTAGLPRRIITEEEGLAIREGTVWRVTNKAHVRFE